MTTNIHHVCLVDLGMNFANAFSKAGYKVHLIRTSCEPFFDLPAALERAGVSPDLVIQAERLGARIILTGLDQLDCPVMFWALDPHLNAHWQSVYGRLFDVVCSTQKAWMDALKQQGVQDVRWLPWCGLEMPLNDWSERQHGLAFVGRMTKERPSRKWMVEFLESRANEYNPAIRQKQNYFEMMDLYGKSRIIPNESISGEVNLRLFEGASSGCLVLNQELEELSELFEPGREIDTYSHVLELNDKLTHHLANDRLASVMGRAAHARIQAEHLPEHRAARMVEYACDANKNRATGAEADKWTALAACAMVESGLLHVDCATVFSKLGAVLQDADVVSMALRMQAATDCHPVLQQNLKALLSKSIYQDNENLNLTASMAALRVGDFTVARAFLYRHCESSRTRIAPPQSAHGLLTLWAKCLARHGRIARPGFSFDAKRHLPQTAAECLLSILDDKPEDLPTLRLLESMLRPMTGQEQTRVGFLSILTLFQRDDWRLALDIALANLHSYRFDSGLEELRLAFNLAEQQGQEGAFLRVLAARDSSGMIVSALEC